MGSGFTLMGLRVQGITRFGVSCVCPPASEDEGLAFRL